MDNLISLHFNDPFDIMENVEFCVNGEFPVRINLPKQEDLFNLHNQLRSALERGEEGELMLRIAGRQLLMRYDYWTAALKVLDEWAGTVFEQ